METLVASPRLVVPKTLLLRGDPIRFCPSPCRSYLLKSLPSCLLPLPSASFTSGYTTVQRITRNFLIQERKLYIKRKVGGYCLINKSALKFKKKISGDCVKQWCKIYGTIKRYNGLKRERRKNRKEKERKGRKNEKNIVNI